MSIFLNQQNIPSIIFNKLCQYEVKKRLNFLSEHFESSIDGYICCLEDLFNITDDDFENISNYVGFFDIINEILLDKTINNLILSNIDMHDNHNHDILCETIRIAVDNYLESNILKVNKLLKI